MPTARCNVVIISPVSALANNGNWRTAHRWQRMLGRRHAVTVAERWPIEPASVVDADLLIVLHAGRSAASLAAFAAAAPSKPTVVVLTGTDLYRDLVGTPDVGALRSLQLATRLVVLQPDAIDALPADCRGKAVIIEQSAPTLARRSPDPQSFECVMVGHLRDEKDPATAWRAFERVARYDRAIRLVHIGDALDARLGEQATALAARNAGYRWLGGLSHALTRQRIRRARLLIIPSVMEGGANVVIEAITSGVPVLASAIPGNLGLLGRGYAGTFPAGDDAALAALIDRARREPAFLALLTRQCLERAPLFTPERERDRLTTLVDSLLAAPTPSAAPSPPSGLP